MIKIINLYKDYVSSDSNITPALKNINLDFPNHGFVSILGPSGCGKSTLLNLLGTLDTPTKGRIYIDGTLVNELDDKSKDILRNKYIGFVFQSYHLIKTLDAKENVELPLLLNTELEKEEIKNKVNDQFDSINLADQKDKKTYEMSGGQVQRVAIARALINDPKIILADEPTGALDSKNSEIVMQILKDISKEKLVIIVTHNNELAEKYSDEIIKLKDGEIEEKIVKNPLEVASFERKTFEKPKKKNFFASEKIIRELSLKNMFSKKIKTIFSALANCFGLVSFGLILALTYGFNVYSQKVSEATSLYLPINVPAYSVKGDETEWLEINQSVEFPDKNEIYPDVKTTKTNDYTYNVYTREYLNLLETFVSDGLASEYLINYGNDYSYNLVTEFPASIDRKTAKQVSRVNTTVSAGGPYTNSSYGIPTNIFHPLYGRIDETYDVIAGKMPTKDTELVLVVNQYNSVSFETLQNLGFYSTEDTQAEVMNKALSTKVIPINFDDIIGNETKPAKKYKIFTNDEMYEKDEEVEINDFFTTDSIESKKTKTHYKTKDLDELFANDGTELTICGIIRPKKDSPLSISPASLCYLPELQTKLTENKKKSEITNDLFNNFIGIDDSNHENRAHFINDMTALATRYQNGKADINSTTFNELMDRYFEFYPLEEENLKEGKFKDTEVLKFEDFIKYSRSFGADLVDNETIKACLSGNRDDIYTYFSNIYNDFHKPSQKVENYKKLVSLGAFLNAYTDILNIAIFPTGIEQRAIILQKLDKFNESKSSDYDRIYYYEYSNPLVKFMGNMIAIVQMVLTIFVIVLVIVACAMNILFTYNNVLERKKDIGILRAIGTSKLNVSKLFVIESALIGAISGLFSSLFVYLLTFPINIMSAQYFEDYFVRYNKIADMTFYHPIILLFMGAILGILSALIPSYIAAKKDPVECLRDN